MGIKQLAVLGSTGSIGKQTLEIVEANPDRFAVYSLTAHKNIDLLEQQINKFKPKIAALADRDSARVLRARIPGDNTRIISGNGGMEEAVTADSVDIAVVAVSGISGLLPTMAAINAGKRIALANKETMVAAGDIVTVKARENNAEIIPVDSEHSAIFQCLHGKKSEIDRLILTASGGPFRGYSVEELRRVTPEMALAHPNWSMGKRITVDSATLMNKGLELIEAHWLFGVSYDQMDVVIHPQSIIHSMVEYVDGTVLANLGVPSMKIPIQYSLTWPERIAAGQRIDFAEINTLTFEEPDLRRFPCLELARSAGKEGGIMPVVLNAADEVAVNRFLEGRIAFSDISFLVEKTLEYFPNVRVSEIDTILEYDRRARDYSESLAASL